MQVTSTARTTSSTFSPSRRWSSSTSSSPTLALPHTGRKAPSCSSPAPTACTRRTCRATSSSTSRATSTRIVPTPRLPTSRAPSRFPQASRFLAGTGARRPLARLPLTRSPLRFPSLTAPSPRTTRLATPPRLASASHAICPPPRKAPSSTLAGVLPAAWSPSRLKRLLA